VNGRVGELHCRYRLVGNRPPVAATTRRLDTLVREEVAPALVAALERELGDDPAVYVLRHVTTTTTTWHQAQTGSDGTLGRGLGERLAGSVLRAITDPGDPANLVRFDDQAGYVAHFLTDLLHGVAWDRWYYGAFAHLRTLGAAGAAARVLREHRDQLPAILADLRRRDQLERLLAVLDQQTLRLLWPDRADGAATADRDRARPLLEAAFRVADRLELWAGQRPDPGPLLEAYLASRPLPASWRDRADLTAAVADAVRLLAGRGHLRRRPGALGDTGAALDHALAELDWLDTGLLRRELTGLLLAAPDQDRGLPHRPTGGPTARQRQLLLDLAAVTRADGPRLDPDRLDSPANALRLLAALVAAFPRWSGDATAGGLLGHLLAAAHRLGPSRAPGLALDRLGRGDPAGALLTLPPDERAMAAPSFAALARLGPPGAEVAALLADVGGLARPAGPAAGVRTGCAGAYLLLRAAVDVRLPALAAGVGYPDAGTVLLALALRWAGEAGSSQDRVDPGLAVLGGHDGAVPLQTLRRRWAAIPPDRHRRWQEILLAALGQTPPPDPAGPDDTPAALRHGQLGLAEADEALGRGAAALLRHWARWLRGFSSSSVPYLLDNFIRRSGRVLLLDDGELLVELEPRPLDPVLELAGYTDELDLRGLLGRERLRFRMEAS
jgi:hypothetical protein